MKQTLPNADDLTTLYALNELDPAEAAVFRKAMDADADLLIEAESQRRTWQRISELPQMSAPAGLLDDTVRLAAGRRRSFPMRVVTFPPAVRWAAAAVVLIAAGWNLMPGGSWPGTETAPSAVIEESGAPADTQAQPWVDRRDVLRLGQQASVADSAGTLRPIEDSTGGTGMRPPRQLQLTGTKSSP